MSVKKTDACMRRANCVTSVVDCAPPVRVKLPPLSCSVLIQMSVDIKGKVFINDAEIAINELIPKLKAITDARGGLEERIYLRADKKADYGTVAKVMGLLSGAGFKKLALVTEADQGS